MNYENPRDYIFSSTICPVFEDDKKKMELQERQIDKEFIKWKRLYQDILPLLWVETGIVSHSSYEELEKLITIGNPDYKF
jgi:hypothetical protein